MQRLVRLFIILAVSAASTSAGAQEDLCPDGEPVGGLEGNLFGDDGSELDLVGFWEIEGLGGGGLVAATPINIPAPPSPDGSEISATPINIPAPPSPDGSEISATPINIPAPPSPDWLSLVLVDDDGVPVGFVLGEPVGPDPEDDSIVGAWVGEYTVFTADGAVYGGAVLLTDGAAVSGAFFGGCASD